MRTTKLAWWAASLVLGLGVAGVFLWESRGLDSSANARPRNADAVSAGARFARPMTTHVEGSLTIVGVVLDAQGPVAGVRVSASRVDADTLSQRACASDLQSRRSSCAGKTWLTKCCFRERGSELARLVAAREGEAPVFAQTVTADDGTFVLDGLPGGAFTLWAQGDRGTAMRPEVPAGSTGVSLMQEASIFLSGTVVDENTWVPIPGARVTGVLEAQSRFFDALTDAQGRFRIGPLPPGRYLRVVSAQGWRTTAFRDSVWLDTDEDVTLEVQKQVQLEGLVLTTEGQPASGVTVHVFSTGVTDDTQSTQSDAQGHFIFEDVAGSPATLWAWNRDETAFGDVRVTPPAKVVFRVEPVTFMEGTVSDERGRPLEGVLLQAGDSPLGDKPSPEALSDTSGHYKLGPLPQAAMNLRLLRARYRNRNEEVDLRAPHPGPWNFTLQRTGSVEGWVVDTEGTPLSGIRLSLFKGPGGAMQSDFIGETEARSDDTGHFILDIAAEGSGYLFARSEDFSSVEQPVEFPSSGVRVVLSRGASVAGRVVDAKGAPLPHVDVQLWDTSPRVEDPRSLPVDSEGAFSATGLTAGHYILEARLQTPGIEHSVSRPIKLEAHSQATVSLRFEEGRTVKGLTVDTDGQPLAGVRVQACFSLEEAPAWRIGSPSCDADRERGVLSGQDGHFVLNHLMDPAYQLVAWKEGHAFVPARSRGGTSKPTALVVMAGAEDVRLVLQERPWLRAQVVSEDGMPLPSEVWGWNHRVPAPAGAVEFPLLKDGPGQVTVMAKGFFDLERDFVVSPGQDIDLGTLVMRRSRKTRFVILDEATHAPLVGAPVVIGPSDSDDRSYTGLRPDPFFGNLDTEGGANVEGLPFTPIIMSVTLRPGGPSTDVVLDARQETVTLLLPTPNR
ncbi:carboxypeptidase regulatory-like domain-containing protein [Corallococcus carmarthensis]|nr:carboxypeptidase regulatory-like domain-containing protein [Corallococcus carmarthensis]